MITATTTTITTITNTGEETTTTGGLTMNFCQVETIKGDTGTTICHRRGRATSTTIQTSAIHNGTIILEQSCAQK